MSQKENCTFWFWFLAQLLLTKIFNQQVIFRCLELALPLLHWLKYSFTIINFLWFTQNVGTVFWDMVYTKIELFFSHTTVRLISWQKKRLGLRFGPPCTYNNRVLSDGSELQRQNNWQTRPDVRGSCQSWQLLFIELVLHFVLLCVVLVTFLKVFWQNDVPVLSHRLHPSLPAHTSTVCWRWYL